ncbi:hypothetical protein ACLB2K_068984 [Fragaria x ananassa]
MTSNTDGPAMPYRLPHEASHPKPQENFQEGDDIYDDVNDFSYTWETNQPSDSDRQHMENDDDVHVVHDVDENYHDVPDFAYSWELGASHCASAGIPNTPQHDPEFDPWFAFLRLEQHKQRQLKHRFALLKGISFFMSLKANPSTPPPAEPSSSSNSSMHVHEESCLGIPLMRSTRPPQCSYFDSNAYSCSYFDCNVCLNMAREPVVTSCGHVYCRPCLYGWLNCPRRKDCLVCKSKLSESLITPIRKGINTTENKPTGTSAFKDVQLIKQ